MGDTKGGAFDVPGELARRWLLLPLNPNGRPNSDVLRPWMNGMDLTRRSADKWIIDFGWEMDEREAALYEAPFAHCLANVKPERDKNRREAYRRFWWRHVEPPPGMLAALKPLTRVLRRPQWQRIGSLCRCQRPFVLTTNSSLSLVMTTSRLESSKVAFMTPGRSGFAHGSASGTIRDIRQARPLKRFPSRMA